MSRSARIDTIRDMPTWLAVVLAILALPILATLVTLRHQRKAAERAEHGELRRAGAAVVTPVQEAIGAFAPAALSLGREEQLHEHLRGWRASWVERRQALMVYANAHPEAEVRRRTDELDQAVVRLIGASTYFVMSQFNDFDLATAYNEAQARFDEATDGVQALLNEIR